MMRRWYAQLKLTHLPTGISVVAEETRHRPGLLRLMEQRAKSLLAARVARPEPEVKTVVRSYHLHTYFGVTPFVCEENRHARKLAEGSDQIERMLNGRIPLPKCIPTPA